MTRTSNRYGMVWSALLLMGGAGPLLGCSEQEPIVGGGGEVVDRTQTALSVQGVLPLSHTEVKGIRFDVWPVACYTGTVIGPVVTQTRELEDQTIPGNLANLQNNPLDENSAHQFADLFLVVNPGCYTVVVTPVDGHGRSSRECARAWKQKIQVSEGLTTEVFLLNQCKGTDPGALDIIAALNREPKLEDVRFTDSKFACGSPTEVCVSASDPDGDPLEFTLSTASPACTVKPLGPTKMTPAGTTEQCFELRCNDQGKAPLVARVYDQLWDGTKLMRIEDWLTTQGYPNQSHAQLQFHSYMDGVKWYPDADGDGHGSSKAKPVLLCADDDPPPGHVPSNDDCDDADPNNFPGNKEVCDDRDNNCDGQADEDLMCSRCPEPRSCGNFIPNECHDCSSGPSAAFCFQAAEGGSVCTDNFLCNKPACSQSSDCADPDAVCLVETCCGVGQCVVPSLMCSLQSTEVNVSMAGTAAGQQPAP